MLVRVSPLPQDIGFLALPSEFHRTCYQTTEGKENKYMEVFISDLTLTVLYTYSVYIHAHAHVLTDQSTITCTLGKFCNMIQFQKRIEFSA